MSNENEKTGSAKYGWIGVCMAIIAILAVVFNGVISSKESSKEPLGSSSSETVKIYTYDEAVEKTQNIKTPVEIKREYHERLAEIYGLDINSNKIEDILKNDAVFHVSENFDKTYITGVTINPNMATEQDDYIVLIDLKWNVENTIDTSQKVLSMYSDDFAASMKSLHSEISEIVVFWNIPYLNMSAKYSYESKNDKMYLTDNIWN